MNRKKIEIVGNDYKIMDMPKSVKNYENKTHFERILLTHNSTVRFIFIAAILSRLHLVLQLIPLTIQLFLCKCCAQYCFLTHSYMIVHLQPSC